MPFDSKPPYYVPREVKSPIVDSEPGTAYTVEDISASLEVASYAIHYLSEALTKGQSLPDTTGTILMTTAIVAINAVAELGVSGKAAIDFGVLTTLPGIESPLSGEGGAPDESESVAPATAPSPGAAMQLSRLRDYKPRSFRARG